MTDEPDKAPAAVPAGVSLNALAAVGAPEVADRAVQRSDGRLSRLLAGPSGLGTSARRLARGPGHEAPGPDAGHGHRSCSRATPAGGALPGISQDRGPARPASLAPLADVTRADACRPLPYTEREWGDGSHPPLYCPQVVRIDECLADEVNERLVSWAGETGIYAGQLGKFRDAGFGRLAMLIHPDTDDPDALLLAAQMNAAWWAADDYYTDDTALGATPTELPPRLALAMSAMDPAPPAGDYTRQLDEALHADPVLVALQSATAHLARHATSAQVMRVCATTFQMYVSWAAYAAWRYLKTPPPAWRHLAARQYESFYASMTLIDVVAGYELAAGLFSEPRFHRALMQAGTASAIVNDLHSAAREAAELPDSNIVLLIAAEQDCSGRQAIEQAVDLHDHFVHGFEASQTELATTASPELHRFLRGAQAWMAGGLEWHASSDRYK